MYQEQCKGDLEDGVCVGLDALPPFTLCEGPQQTTHRVSDYNETKWPPHQILGTLVP